MLEEARISAIYNGCDFDSLSISDQNKLIALYSEGMLGARGLIYNSSLANNILINSNSSKQVDFKKSMGNFYKFFFRKENKNEKEALNSTDAFMLSILSKVVKENAKNGNSKEVRKPNH